MSADDLKVWFPIKRGLLRRVVGHIKAVDGVDVGVREGQTLGVVGESGSGKTTLGLALMRLISSKGKIVFLKSPTSRARPSRKCGRSAAKCRSSSRTPTDRSVRACRSPTSSRRGSRFTAGTCRPPSATARWCRRWRRWALDPATRHRYPHEFSGGQRQRIAVARAMVLEPRFVMLDEPTSALDMSVQAQVVDLLRDLQRRHNLSYLFISHDLKVVKALANDIIVMRAGKVVEKGEAAKVFDHPETDYTRALMAAAFDIRAAPEGVVSQ